MLAVTGPQAPWAGASPRTPLPPYPELNLKAWRFDQEGWLTDPSSAPLAALNLQWAESWSGYALCLSGPAPAIFALAEVGADGRLNLSMNGPGTIRFWFAPEWTSSRAGGEGPGTEVRLLEIGAWSGNEAVGWCSLRIDPFGTALGLVARDGEMAATILEAPIGWTVGQWHQVALGWTPEGSSVLYLDGQVAAQGTGLTLKGLTAFAGTRGFCVGSDVQGGRLAQGRFEEVYTFGRALTLAEVALDYERNAARAALGPVRPEEEKALLAGAAMARAQEGPAERGESQFSMGSIRYECGLWLEIGQPSSGMVPVTLHNAKEGVTYELWSNTNLNSPTWTLEQTLTGTNEETTALISLNGVQTNFFRAVQIEDVTGYEICRSFEGIGYTEVQSAVPDSMGAVGPNHFVEIVNSRIVVFNRDGSRTGQEDFLLNFFQAPPDGLVVDPRVLYDHPSAAWVACAVDIKLQHKTIVLATKEGADPTPLSAWRRHSIPVAYESSIPDHPTLGVDKNGVYVTALQHHLDPVTHQQVNDAQTILAIKKPAIYAGTLSYTQFTIDTDPAGLQVWTIQPAVNFDDALNGDYTWLVAKGPPQHGPPYRGGALYYRRLQWNASGATEFVDLAWQLVAEPTPTYRDYFDLEDGTVRAPQLGDPPEGPPVIDLNVVGSRLMTAVIRDNVLWTCHHVGLEGPEGTYASDDATGVEVDRSAVQWIKLSLPPEGTGLSYVGHGRVFDHNEAPAQAVWYYFPSLMVNKNGDIITGFSGASSETYISAYYSWRLAGGAAANVPILIQAGQFYHSQPRLGDYSATTLDPVDGLNFWTVQEFAKNELEPPFDEWGSIIAKLTPVLEPGP